MNKEEIQKLLNYIYTDILMLKDGEWQPDIHSCQDSLNTIKELAKELNIEVKDTRINNPEI